uniref:Uncharacterized protein n=2 Tax=Timema TaxID=61471 RepID=A0A7R9EKS4_9NEOP|nr:unnamed protein product [Timema cristinae]CAD7435112.1 unnamed protein product [Timema monikensis]
MSELPPFEVLEVWLEGVSMHLSVGMPLPHNLEFDIYNYTGRSPNSSESSTPEALTPAVNPSALQPINERESFLPKPRTPSPVERTSL